VVTTRERVMHSNISRLASFGSRPAVWGILAAVALAVGCGPDPAPGTPSGTGQGGAGASGGMGGAGGTGGAGTGGDAGNGGSGAWDPNAGWTELPKASDATEIYVSSSDGNDNNDGKTPATAVKTIAKGKSLLTDGKPDRLLLKRGDVWNEGLGTWTFSGRSAAEPMVVATYGDAMERPMLKTGTQRAIQALATATIDHVAFVGLHFYAHTRDPDSPDFTGITGTEAVGWFAKSSDILFEDMMVQFYANTNFTVQTDVTGDISDFRLRRSVVADAYFNKNSEGIYAQGVKGLLIEENVFDHNGWNNHAKLAGMGTGKTVFNHNMYVLSTCEDVTIRGNISTRASSHGFQARAGGIVEDNLVIDNPIGFSFGLVEGAGNPKPGGVTGHVSGNVVRDAGDISTANPRGFGMQIGNIQSAIVEDNIFAHDKSEQPYGAAIELNRKKDMIVPDEAIKNLTFRNNIIYDWRGGARFSTGALTNVLFENNDFQAPDPMRPATLVLYFSMGFSQGTVYSGNHWFSTATNWFTINLDTQSYNEWLTTSKEMGSTNTKVTYPDPERRLSTYQESLGKTNTFDAYIAEARKQSRKNWRYEYTAAGPIGYIRQGFGKN
jgi:hypothetical protein